MSHKKNDRESDIVNHFVGLPMHNGKEMTKEAIQALADDLNRCGCMTNYDEVAQILKKKG